MKPNKQQVSYWIDQLSHSMQDESDDYQSNGDFFINNPDAALLIAEEIQHQDNNLDLEYPDYYSACILALDLCVVQIQAYIEKGQHHAELLQKRLMAKIAQYLRSGRHSLEYWSPILSIFYEVHADLSEDLQNAYIERVEHAHSSNAQAVIPRIDSIQNVLNEIQVLSVFEQAEYFFSQSYAMPFEFFIDLVADLFALDAGRDVALLALLHPKNSIREILLSCMDEWLETTKLSEQQLTRLQAISTWYPEHAQHYFSKWIRDQRKKEVVFTALKSDFKVESIHASEIDGLGAQGLFIQLRQKKEYVVCAILVKQNFGIKDVWLTKPATKSEMALFQKDVFSQNMVIRRVDYSYFQTIIEHFLADTLSRQSMPPIFLLALQETLGMRFLPQEIDSTSVVQHLAVQIEEFTELQLQRSLKRSKNWLQNKFFAESWRIEGDTVDKIVNEFSAIEDGERVCDYMSAAYEVVNTIFEEKRADWLFHFLWVALWLRSSSRPSEVAWIDAAFIAHEISRDTELANIPLIFEIAFSSVLHSANTMQERRSHLQ